MDTNYIAEYNQYLATIKSKFQECNKRLSEIDLKEQDLLHFLEFEKCDAITMMKVVKKLKEVRAKRREIKDEFDKINAVYTRLCNLKNLKESEITKHYNYKTSIISEL